jgi:site-specific DNA recombinase
VKQALRAALYARYSTDKQSSISAQFRVCKQIAKQHGFTVCSEYSDAAISGGTAQRPGYQSMLDAARRSEFDVIVAEDTSRLWRSLSEQSPRLAELEDLDIAVVTIDLDTRRDDAELIGPLNGAISQKYRKEIGRRVYRTHSEMAEDGEPCGGRAYGYVAARDNDGKIAINRQEAQWVVWIFGRYAEGMSPRRVADELNRKGVPSPGAKWNRKKRRQDAKWLMTAVRAILRNERYVGRVVWGRTRWKRLASDSSKRIKLPPKTPAIVKQRPDLRIIDDKLWNAVQARIKAASAGRTTFRVDDPDRGRKAYTGHGGKAHKHAMSGLLKCSCCKQSYVIADSRSYACASHRDGGPSACDNALRARRDVIEGVVVGGLQEHLLSPEWLAKIESWTLDRVKAAQKAQAANANAGVDRLKAVEAQIARVTDAIAEGAMGGSKALADKLQALEAERDALTQRASPVAPIRVVPRLGERVKGFLRDLQSALHRNPDQARMYLRRLLAGPVLLEPDGDLLYANFAMDDTRVALNVSATPGVRDLGGSGGRI